MALNVCVLTSVHAPYDVRIFHRECRALRDAGYEVTLVAPADFQRQERDGITVLGVPKPSRRLGRPLVWWRLFQQVRRLRPDVVHFHDPELLLLVPLLRLALGRRVKIVYDAHEYFIDSLTVKKWIPHGLRPAVKFVTRWLERILVRGLDGIVCSVEGLKPLYGYFCGPVAVVRNVPAASLFQGGQPHPSLDGPGFKIIYIGLLLPQRDIGTVLEAIWLLRQRGVDDIRLILIGPETSPSYLQELRDYIQTHQLGEQVRLMGAIPHEQVKHYLANVHVGLVPVVLTRQYSNVGISTKLFEYMLCGLPIVAADSQDYRPYIKECNGGRIVPVGDAGAYAEAFQWLRDHPEEARAMGQRGQEMVLDHYIWEQEQLRLLAFYRTVVNKV
jgi:glycosyltransferase involved in cell wall biosynthesis